MNDTICDKCNSLYNITKDVKGKQIGGKINLALKNILKKFREGEVLEKADIEDIKLKDLQYDEQYENLKKKDQKKLLQEIKSLNKELFTEKNMDTGAAMAAFFICKKCKNSKPIPAGTTIYSINYGTSNQELDDSIDYTHVVHDKTLARTKNYICPYEDCPTHSDNNIKEAVIIKNLNHQIVYICCICVTNWIYST
jgi:hypothetical protein